MKFDFQETAKHADIFTDRDCSGRNLSCSSASADCAKRVKRSIKTWSTSEGTIELKPGEAEFLASPGLITRTDPQQPRASTHARGKIKHIDVQFSQIQQHAAMNGVGIKQRSDDNAD